jgi:hypothetical protein
LHEKKKKLESEDCAASYGAAKPQPIKEEKVWITNSTNTHCLVSFPRRREFFSEQRVAQTFSRKSLQELKNLTVSDADALCHKKPRTPKRRQRGSSLRSE